MTIKCNHPGQPIWPVSITLKLPDNIDFVHLDDWLENALSIEVQVLGVHSRPPGFPNHVFEFVWRCLLLYRTLLKFSGIPVFDVGSIRQIQCFDSKKSLWHADVSVVLIENIPRDCFSSALEQAIKILNWCAISPNTPSNRAHFFDFLEKCIKPLLRKWIISGQSTIPVLEVAHRMNIPFLYLGAGVYQLGWGKNSRKIDRSTTDSDSAIGSKLSHNKVWATTLIRMAGLPAPVHIVVKNIDEAILAAQTLGWPLVVKPSDRDRGEGITIGVCSNEQLLLAFHAAGQLSGSGDVIIEKQVKGVCHRLFIFDRELLYAVKRLPKSVFGDGKHTVAELIEEANLVEKNRPPWLKRENFPNDDLAFKAMQEAGFSIDSIPGNGDRIPLRLIESTESGGYDENVTDFIHPDNLDIALRAASLFNLEVVGVDIISPDIGQAWHKNGAIINEVNFAPLLGGAEISKSHIPAFLGRLLADSGRIPIEVFVGNEDAMSAAQARRQQMLDQGQCYHLTSHELSLTPEGDEINLPFNSLCNRCLALLLNRRVEALILVVQTNELLQTAMPIDRINKLNKIGASLLSTVDDFSERDGFEKLCVHLQNYVW